MLYSALGQFASRINTPMPSQAQTAFFYGLTVLLCAVIIGLRQPTLLTSPQLIVEDGTIFFAQSFNLSSWDALTTSYAGYHHLIARLIAEIGSLLPYKFVALFYSLCALFITSMAFAWFTLPFFRHLLADDKVRLLMVMLFLCSPHVEGVMLIAYLQWFVALWAFFVSMMITPANRWLQAAILLGYVLAIRTSPILFILLPIWWVRLLGTRSPTSWFTVVFITGVQLLYTIYATESGFSLATLASQPSRLLLDLIRSIAYKIVALPLLGHTITEKIFMQWGWNVIYLMLLCVLSLFSWFVWQERDRERLALYLILFYFLAAASMLYLLRIPAYGFVFEQIESILDRTLARYFFLGSIAFYLILFTGLNGLQQRVHSHIARYIVLGSGVLLCLFYLPSFYLPDYGKNQWPVYAEMLEWMEPKANSTANNQFLPRQTRADSLALRNQYPNQLYLPLIYNAFPQGVDTTAIQVSIPIPVNWQMNLYISPNQHHYALPEGPILWGLRSKQTEEQLQVRILWQGNKVAKNAEADAMLYTSYVHLVDPQSLRISGYDILVEPQNEQDLASGLFFIDYPLSLPSSALKEEYRLVIGLYHWVDGQVVQDSSVEVYPPLNLKQKYLK